MRSYDAQSHVWWHAGLPAAAADIVLPSCKVTQDSAPVVTMSLHGSL